MDVTLDQFEQLTLTANISGKARREKMDGREFLVAPITLLVPGILNGSNGSLLYMPEDVKKSTPDWDKIPLTIQHPTENGHPVSASDADVYAKFGVGYLRYPRFHAGALKAEGWFDSELTKNKDERVYDALINGVVMEISTGLGTRNEKVPPNTTWQGQPYVAIARDYKPDHLAILPSARGACSIRDGCGLLINQANQTEIVDDLPDVSTLWSFERVTVDNASKYKIVRLPQKPVGACHNCGEDGECAECMKKRLAKLAENDEDPSMEKSGVKKGVKVTNETTTNQLSHNDLRGQLSKLVDKRFGLVSPLTASPMVMSAYVVDVYDKEFIYERSGKLWRLGYMTDLRTDSVSISDASPVEVKRITQYKAVQNHLMLEKLGEKLGIPEPTSTYQNNAGSEVLKHRRSGRVHRDLAAMTLNSIERQHHVEAAILCEGAATFGMSRNDSTES
jgi:hypothetical protein